MANTHRFNVKVKLGGKAYPPGSDVPIGGKHGLPKEEIARVEKRFGKWTGRTLSDQEQIAALATEKRDLETALSRVDPAAAESARAAADTLKADLAKANEEIAGLKKALEEAESDNQVLAARVAELEKGGGQ